MRTRPDTDDLRGVSEPSRDVGAAAGRGMVRRAGRVNVSTEARDQIFTRTSEVWSKCFEEFYFLFFSSSFRFRISLLGFKVRVLPMQFLEGPQDKRHMSVLIVGGVAPFSVIARPVSSPAECGPGLAVTSGDAQWSATNHWWSNAGTNGP